MNVKLGVILRPINLSGGAILWFSSCCSSVRAIRAFTCQGNQCYSGGRCRSGFSLNGSTHNDPSATGEIMLSRLYLLLFCLLAACSNLTDLKTPTATVMAVRPIASKGMLPNFAIDLHLSNPNAQDLSLRGASYTLSLEGQELVSGVTNKLPVLPAYGEADVTLTAVPDVLATLGLAQKLMQKGGINALHYRLEARLDLAALLPDMVIEKEGLIGQK
jgi:LEA14-like dessication related protein